MEMIFMIFSDQMECLEKISEIGILIFFAINIKWMIRQFNNIVKILNQSYINASDIEDYAENFFKKVKTFLWLVFFEAFICWLIYPDCLSVTLTMGIPCVTVFIVVSGFITNPHYNQLQNFRKNKIKTEIYNLFVSSLDYDKSKIDKEKVCLYFQLQSEDKKFKELTCVNAYTIKPNGSTIHFNTEKFKLDEGKLVLNPPLDFTWDEYYSFTQDNNINIQISLEMSCQLSLDNSTYSFNCSFDFNYN